MYKLLIVDDEVWVRERLMRSICWEEIGIEIVGVAEDGEEAFDLTNKLNPDIVLTDIRMPLLNGLDYIRKIKESNLMPKIVIISGYNDFEYAQKAIRVGATDYILKPFEDQILYEVIFRCIAEIQYDSYQKDKIDNAEKLTRSSEKMTKEKYLLELINGYFDNDKEILYQTKKMNAKIQGHLYTSVVIQVENFENLHKQNWNKKLYLFAIENIANEILQRCGNVECFCNNGDIICLVSSNLIMYDFERMLLSICNGIRRIAAWILENPVSIGIGFIYDAVSYISVSYNEAIEAVLYKKYYGLSKVYYIKTIDKNITTKYKADYTTNKLLGLLNSGNKEGAVNEINSIIKKLTEKGRTVYPIDLKFLYSDLAGSIIKNVLSQNCVNSFSEYCMIYFQQLEKLSDVDEACKWLQILVERILDNNLNKDKGTKRKVVEDSIKYIHDHFDEPMTLSTMANVLFFNSSYLCKIFKDVTGEHFTKYLMKYRIQKAMGLLNTTNLKVYQIAEMVGYNDIQYFTKIFKTLQGVSPVQYRNLS